MAIHRVAGRARPALGRAHGVVTQFFLNMEVERYTLATGETVLTGFNRFWRHWGLLFLDAGRVR